MSSDSSSPIITVTNTEFWRLVHRSKHGIPIDCQGGWYEISCPACTRTYRIHKLAPYFTCPFCTFLDDPFHWRPDKIPSDGSTLRPIGWKTAFISED